MGERIIDVNQGQNLYQCILVRGCVTRGCLPRSAGSSSIGMDSCRGAHLGRSSRCGSRSSKAAQACAFMQPPTALGQRPKEVVLAAAVRVDPGLAGMEEPRRGRQCGLEARRRPVPGCRCGPGQDACTCVASRLWAPSPTGDDRIRGISARNCPGSGDMVSRLVVPIGLPGDGQPM